MIHEFYKRLAMGEVVNSLFIVATKPLTLINSLVVIGLLSLHDFGVYRLVMSFQALISGFSINFLDNLVLNEMNVHHGENRAFKAKRIFAEYVVLKVIIGAILTVGVFFLADFIGGYYDSMEGIGSWIRIISFLFLIENIHSLAVTFLQYRLNFFLSSFYLFAYEGVKLIFILALYFFGNFGISEVLILTVFSHLIVFPFVLIPSFRGYFEKSTGDSKSVSSGFGSPFVALIRQCGFWTVARYYLLNFSQNIRPWVVKWLLGTEAVAIFSVALSFLGSLKSFISFNSLKVYLPRESGKRDRMREIVLRGGRYLTYVFFALFVFGIIAVPIVTTIFFPKYWSSMPLFFIMAASMVFFGVYTISGQILYSLRRQKDLFFVAIASAVSMSIFSIILIPVFGLYGVALEFFLTQFVALAASQFFLFRYNSELKFQWKTMFMFDEYDRDLLQKGIKFFRVKVLRMSS